MATTGIGEAALAASGEQHEIASGNQVAVITEVGATLRTYTVGGQAVLDGFSTSEMATGGRGQVLAPWPNRLADGSFDFNGVSCQAPIDEVATNNAIHGLVRWSRWTLAARAQNKARFEHIIYPQPGYKWTLKLALTYFLSGDGLCIETEATNAGGEDLPFGIGFHPYFTCGTETIDSLSLTVPAKRTLICDSRGLPTGSSFVDGTLMDFREGIPLGGLAGITRLDTCFTDLVRDESGNTTVKLLDPESSKGVDVWADKKFGFLMIYSGDTLPDLTRRRRGLAIEPMTCPPNAFRTGDSVITIKPGASWSAKWGIRSVTAV